MKNGFKNFKFFTLLVLAVSIFVPKMSLAGIDCQSVNDSDTDEILEAKLIQCENEIEQQTLLLRDKQRESSSLERDLSVLDYRINTAKLEIKARQINITNLNRDIDSKSNNINQLSSKITRMQSSVAEIIRKTNELQGFSIVEFLFNNFTISNFFIDLGTFETLQASLHEAFDDIKDTRVVEQKSKVVLEDRIEKEREFKSLQEIEERKLKANEAEKVRILKATKGEENKYKGILAEKQSLINEIKSRILKFTGGQELRFDEALKLVRIPESALGVRAAFILAILTQESGIDGVIGRNLGRCFYNTKWNNSAGTVMSNTQKESFLAITKEIGLDPDTTPVSCPIPRDGSYGGAMGPSQFMPNTWWDIRNGTGYKRRVQNLLGIETASPFDNLHAFTATASYLSDGLRGCEAIYRTTYSRESCAASKYYAGGNWRKFMNSYGASVANRAAEFQKDIDVLDSQ